MITSSAADRRTDVARLVPAGGLILVVTDDGSDERFAAVRTAARDLAQGAGAAVLLFHAPSAPPPGETGRPRLFDPLADPRGGAGAATRAPGHAAAGWAEPRLHTGSRRRDLLRQEAHELASRGVPVRVWLSRLCGPSAVAEAVERTAADVVLVAAEREGRGILGRTIRRTLSYYAARLTVPLVDVDHEGRMSVVAPLGSGGLVAAARRAVGPVARATQSSITTPAAGGALR